MYIYILRIYTYINILLNLIMVTITITIINEYMCFNQFIVMTKSEHCKSKQGTAER